HVRGTTQSFEHKSAYHHVHERDRIECGRPVKKIIVHASDGKAVAVTERIDIVQGTCAGIIHHVSYLRLACAPGRLVQQIEPVVRGALVEHAYLGDMRSQRSKSHLP